MAEKALVSRVCVGLRASVLGWDCATHLPNGFTLREKEDRLPHVAPISPRPPSPALAAPKPLGHFYSSRPLHTTCPRLCNSISYALSFFSLSLSPCKTRRGAPLTSTPQKPGPGPQNLVTRIYSVHCDPLDTSLLGQHPAAQGRGMFV